MLKKIIAILVCLTMYPISLQAADATSGWTKVVSIYSPVTGAAPYIAFQSGSLVGCYADSGAYMPLANVDAAARVYSTILSAQMAKRDIKVYYNYNAVADGYSGWGLCNIEAVYTR